MRQLACASFTLLVVFLVYIHRLLNDMIPAYYTNTTRPNPRRTQLDETSERSNRPRCTNLLNSLPDGKWRLRDDITYKQINEYSNIVMNMRLRKGWPPYLYHGDLRCGTKYPLPRLVHMNKTSGYHLDIPSQCDVLSNAPCCRDDIGWCGNGEAFCECKTCTDYRTFVPAELSVWEASAGCGIPRITSTDACRFLDKHFSSVTFIGDSLVRHVFSALLILLTHNMRAGALRVDISKKDSGLCENENQFIDSACHNKLAMSFKDIMKHKDYCSSLANHKKPRLSFVEAYSTKQSGLAIDTIRQKLQERNSLILIGIGVHDSFDYAKVIADVLKPIVELRKKLKNDNSTIIWLNTHASGPLKPTAYRELQGNGKIRTFNKKLQEYCLSNNLVVVDTFNLTVAVHSFDGTHYGFEINRLKTQIILNGLMEKVTS